MPKISDLPTDAAPDPADIVPFVDVTASRTEKVTIADLAASSAFAGQYQPLGSGDTVNDAIVTGLVVDTDSDSFAALEDRYSSYYPGTATGVQLIAAGVLRNGGASSYWQPLDDATHVPIGITSVSTSSTQVVVTLAAPSTGKRIICVAVPDENLAQNGLIMGCSYSTTELRIEMSQIVSIEDYVTYNGSAWTSLNGTVTISSFTAGVLTMTHAEVPGGSVAITGRGGTYVPLLSTASQAIADGTTKVSFYDWAGTLVTTADTNMRFAITKTWHGTRNPQVVGLDASANLWFMAFAEPS